MMVENWNKLSPEEKFEERFKSWMNPDITFASDKAKENYQQITQDWKDALALKNKRVRSLLNVGFYPAKYAEGITCEDIMYDYNKLGEAWKKFHFDFQPENIMSSFIIGSGKVLEILDYQLYQWPGQGVDKNSGYQTLEKEYVKGDEYDKLINDPSGFWMRHYMPRIFGSLKGWANMDPFTDILELPNVGAHMIPVGIPDVQESFKKYLEAGQEALNWISAVAEIDNEIVSQLGVPHIVQGISKAPFDSLGDTLRGTRPILLDIFRRPEKLQKAMDALVPLMIDMGVRSSTQNNNPFVFIPLHKGADGFLSREDFKKYYWPSLKAVMLGLIEEGLVPYLFVEGSYNERVDILNDPDLPSGKVFYLFDDTDMVKAKKALGERFCIAGNVSASMLNVGTPQKVEENVKRLIEDVGKEGFVLSHGVALDDANADNLKAMLEATRKYGQ